MDTHANRTCPICEHSSSKSIYKQQFHGISGATLLDGYDVSVCLRCGGGFADNIPLQEAFDAYYRDLSKYENQHRGGQESEYYTKAYDILADCFKEQIGKDSDSILDVGCATAGLLAALKRRGFSNLLGVDPSHTCSAAAWQIHRIQVLNGTLWQLPVGGKLFDSIILTGVLEHVREVQPAIRTIRQSLSSKGRLHVCVPDVTGFTTWPNAPFQHFSLEHINFFSLTSLANLLVPCGLKLIAYRQIPLEQGPQTIEPVICATFECDVLSTTAWKRDTETELALYSYVQQSQKQHDREQGRIGELARSKQPIIVWGVGTHTQRLLTSSALGEANIRAFVDSNPHYHGKTLHGISIISPPELLGRDEAILISSRMYQQEIRSSIRQELQLLNEIIEFYDLSGG